MLYILKENDNFQIYLLKNNDLLKTAANSNSLYKNAYNILTLKSKIDNYNIFKLNSKICFLYNTQNKIILTNIDLLEENIIYESKDKIIKVEYYIKNNTVFILTLENNRLNTSLFSIKVLCLSLSLEILSEFRFYSEQVPSYLSFVISDFNDVFIAFYDTTLKYISYNTLINRWSKLSEIRKSLETKVLSKIDLKDNYLYIATFSNNTINLYSSNYFKNSEWNLTNSLSIKNNISYIYFIKNTKPLVYIIDNSLNSFLINLQDFTSLTSLDNSLNNQICCYNNEYYLLKDFCYNSEKDAIESTKQNTTIELVKKEDTQDLQVLDLNKILTSMTRLEQKIDSLNDKIDNLNNRKIFSLFRHKP